MLLCLDNIMAAEREGGHIARGREQNHMGMEEVKLLGNT
jgi:hypothetical protein